MLLQRKALQSIWPVKSGVAKTQDNAEQAGRGSAIDFTLRKLLWMEQ